MLYRLFRLPVDQDIALLHSISLINNDLFYCFFLATAYGKGVYFAKNASYSAQDLYSPRDDSGRKRMYLCRVLTGDYTKGNFSIIESPIKGNDKRYHSVVDDVKNPLIFVIFKDTQAYPDYLITFTS